MGVPGLFSYLARKYPKIVEPVKERTDEDEGETESPYHNLYVGKSGKRLL